LTGANPRSWQRERKHERYDQGRRICPIAGIVLRPNTTAADIPGWDSLNQIKIIISCERALGVRLKPREINALENVDEMVDHLMATLRASKRA
jgi:acyl carrier protein